MMLYLHRIIRGKNSYNFLAVRNVFAFCGGLASACFSSLLLAQSQGSLENPAADSFTSGIAMFSGWHCDAETIYVRVDGGDPKVAAYGTSRADTQSICGDENNGFGLLFNMALFGPGQHEAVAYADDVEFARTTFSVAALSTGEFLSGAEARVVVTDFPSPGKSVRLTWEQASQNFMIEEEFGAELGAEQPVFTNGEVSARWNAGIMAFDEQIGFNSCGGQGEECPSISWATVNDEGRGSVLEVSHDGVGLAGIFFSADPNTDMSAYEGGELVFDIKVVDEGSNTSGFYAKVDCVFPCTSNDQLVGVVGLGGWETVSLPIDQLVGAGLNLSTVNTGLVVFPAGGEQQGVVFRLDNVIWKPAPAM